MRPYVFVLLTLIALTSGEYLAAEPQSGRTDCRGDRITISGATPEEIALACAGISDALGFFRQYGFNTDIDIDVTVQPKVLAGDAKDLSFAVLGQYRPRENQVFMTSLETQREMAVDKPVFRVPFAPVQFREVVAHEVAHVLAEHNFTHPDPSRLVHEYIAYIVQMTTMAPERRAEIFAAYTVQPFEEPLDINPMVYAIAPDTFALKTYFYFAAQPDGRAYLRQIMKEDLPGANYTFDLFG